MEDVGAKVNKGVSVIIPVYNEEKTLEELIKRIGQTLSGTCLWEAIVVDDHSSDESKKIALRLAEQYPVKVLTKEGEKGKAQSLREGFMAARYDCISFIDADLQYVPEYLKNMYEKIRDEKADVVVTNRGQRKEKYSRQVTSHLYHNVFAKLLFALPYDTRSGLKMFRRKYLPAAMLNTGPWSFDLSFLWHAKYMGANIGNQDIVFYAREEGEPTIRPRVDGLIMVMEALWLKLGGISPLPVVNKDLPQQAGNGVLHKNVLYVTHSSLPAGRSAMRRLNRWQKVIFSAIALFLLLAFAVDWQRTLLYIIALLTIIYLLDAIFMFMIAFRSLRKSPEISYSPREIGVLHDEELPTYTVLCPLYKEPEVVEQFANAMQALDWPEDKLDVQLLIEKDDSATKKKIDQMNLPDYFTTFVVPPGYPKTKPKACNYGLAYAKGEYVVIFDAEDIPEPDQLKKAYLAFQECGPEIACLQAKLDYYNAKQNLLTRLFASEYNMWFGVVLPGLYSLKAPIPLGGTSNHFRRSVLDELSGWDPFNVTEDCDLGIRLFSMGYRTGIIDSYTHEEANSQVGNWIRQRSRWIKGYMQTQLVASRDIKNISKQGLLTLLVFFLVFVHKTLSVFINPIFWTLTVTYFLAPATVEPITSLFFSGPIGYIGGINMIVGNFLYFYTHMLAAIKSKEWWIVKYAFVIPFYWLLMGVAGWYGFWQLIVKPHYWEKTRHGLNQVKPNVENVSVSKPILELSN